MYYVFNMNKVKIYTASGKSAEKCSFLTKVYQCIFISHESLSLCSKVVTLNMSGAKSSQIGLVSALGLYFIYLRCIVTVKKNVWTPSI